MKILHVFTLPVTAESFFDGQFGYLVANGHEITVIANSALDSGFCRRNNVRSLTAPIDRRMNPVADIRAIVALMREIRRNRYDAVVGHTPKGAMVAMIASLLAGTRRRVYLRHGLVYTTAKGFGRTVLKAVERLTGCCSTHIVNVSPSLSRLAVTDRLNNGSKQTVIGAGTCGGIDTAAVFNPAQVGESDIADIRQAWGIAADDFVVGFCGRLCRDKGIVELIEGFDLFRQKHKSVSARLLLIGGYDERDTLPENVRQLIADSPDIIATGKIAHDKLPLFYSMMDVFVFPSYREGFGMCVVEASAMGVPVLVSRSHGCVDSIREHITGEYIDLSASGICRGIETMLDAGLRKRLGAGGRRFATENFDYKVMWPQILKLYNSILK